MYFRGVVNGASMSVAYSAPPTMGVEQFGKMTIPSAAPSTSIGINAKKIEVHLVV